ncbi:MAG: hypothetical protein Q4G04_06550 [bacterium]|nr:hypothetical protein [bacterium]
MKRGILNVVLIVFLLFGITACKDRDMNIKGGTDILSEHSKLLLTIKTGTKDCVPISLSLYEDGTYELFTEYNNEMNGILQYSKSKKGTYDYDVNKIIENSIDADNKSYSMDNLPEYEIYTLDGHYYTIEKGQKNKHLNKLLNTISVDLNTCAEKKNVD